MDSFTLLALTVSRHALVHVPVFTQYSLPIVAFSILVSAGPGGVQTTNI